MIPLLYSVGYFDKPEGQDALVVFGIACFLFYATVSFICLVMFINEQVKKYKERHK